MCIYKLKRNFVSRSLVSVVSLENTPSQQVIKNKVHFKNDYSILAHTVASIIIQVACVYKCNVHNVCFNANKWIFNGTSGL